MTITLHARGLTALAMLVGALVLWVQPPAHACSCAFIEPDQISTQFEAAFVGTVTEIGPKNGEFGERTWRFRVEAVTAPQDLPDTLDVSAPEGDGGNCGWNLAIGQRVGVGLYASGTGWSASGCSQYEPEALLENNDVRPPVSISASPAPLDGGGRGGGLSLSTGQVAALVGFVAIGLVGATVWGQRRAG